MTNSVTPSVASPFDALRREDEQGEFWSARDLMTPLGYEQWRRFSETIGRAQAAAANTGIDVSTAFVQVAQVANVGNLGIQEGQDFRLTRYAAYLVAMNGDPRKPEIAAAQTYFAVKTREAEVRPMSALDTFAAAVEALRDQERRTAAIEAEQARIGKQQEALEIRASVLEENHDRVTAIGWANLRKVRSDVAYLNRLGRRASQIGKRDGIEVSRAHWTVWGEVNAWPVEVWDEAHAAC